MYLQTCTIRNIKCFEEVALDFRKPDGSPRLWNVILGTNGTGKTTLLQAIAIALMGEKSASVLLPRPVGWVRQNTDFGEIEAQIVRDTSDSLGSQTNPRAVKRTERVYTVQYVVVEKSQDIEAQFIDGPSIIARTSPSPNMLSHLYGSRKGWFSAGYGSYRRLEGGSIESKDILESNQRKARFAGSGSSLTGAGLVVMIDEQPDARLMQ